MGAGNDGGAITCAASLSVSETLSHGKEGVRVHFPLKRWRLALSAAVAAIAVSVTFAAPAFAAEPGEADYWNNEMINNQSMQIASQGTLSEARNAGNLLEVWRGETNNNVWMSLNNGNAFTFGTTATSFSPTVVPYGSNQFMVIHVGTDNNIYYTNVWVNGDGSAGWNGSWNQVPDQTSSNAVSATQMGAGSSNILMMYRGTSNQNIYSTTYLGNIDGTIGWQPAEWVSEGTTFTAPGVAYNPVSGNVYAVVRGLDNQVWMNGLVNGQWGSWTVQGSLLTYAPPQIAANAQTGSMLVSAVGQSSNTPYYRAYTSYGAPRDYWSSDITGWQTVYAVGLALYGSMIYALFTGQNGLVYYKPAYNG
jgi:hypothetical protein